MSIIATIAAAYSANKGAASMVQALVDNLPDRIPGSRLVAISTHPVDDRLIYGRTGIPLEVTSQRPWQLVLIHLPLALVAGLLRVMHLPWRWVCRPAALRAIRDATVVADLSGISFVDGRNASRLVYNTMVVAVPLLLGTPVVKCAQAMGPFATRTNRLAARLVLPRLERICARGVDTEEHLRRLHLRNVISAGDLGFVMSVPGGVRERMQSRLSSIPAPYLVVSPSQVVDSYCKQMKIDYRGILAEFVSRTPSETGHSVILVAHSAQSEQAANHMNDLPLCRDIYRRVSNAGRTIFFDEDLLPTQLRALIGEADLVLTSRFHAMISALAEAVPVLVIGWSHKYSEILDAFDLDNSGLSYTELSDADTLLARSRGLLQQRSELVVTIGRALPRVRDAALVNLDVLAAASATSTEVRNAARTHPRP